MNIDVETDLPNIRKIDTVGRETIETPTVRIWFENGAKVQVLEDELDSVERQWFRPDHLGEPEAARVVDDATVSEASPATVGLETVADYLAFEDEGDARGNWGDEYVNVLLDK